MLRSGRSLSHAASVLEETSSAELLAGTTISIRPLTPMDAPAVVALYDSLTDEDRYFRFFTWRPANLQATARSLTDRAAGHCSIGAFTSDQLLGVANYVVSNATNEAEVAVVVAPDQHLRGVGTAVLHRLGSIARDNGVERFVAEVLWENRLMLRVLADAGWPCTRHLEDGVFHIEIDLREGQ